MARVLLTGLDSPVGRRVRDLLEADDAVDSVVAIDLDSRDLKDDLDGGDVLMHLGRSDTVALDGTGIAGVDLSATARLLDAAGSVGIDTMVILSSATVYGAWANNPVPLTETAPLRPNPALAFATRKAEVERMVGEWRTDHPSARVAILRPTVAVAAERASWLAASPWTAHNLTSDDAERLAQFVHLDDLASALDLARRRRLEGAYNVAPDGWITEEQLRALAGRGPSVRLPARLFQRLAAWRWRFGMTSVPPGVVAYTSHSWVIANDRLRAEGWEPQYTNEEAFVSTDRPTGWSRLSPRRRQEIALAGAGAGLIGLGAGAFALIRRNSRR